MSSLRLRLVPVLAALGLLGLACADPVVEDRPNVVLVVVDTLRADVIDGAIGEADTPHIDALVQEGFGFPRAYAHAPMTLPSHTALFSSTVPLESGVLNNWQTVPEDLPLFTEQLARHGYSTRAIVSLGTLSPPPGNPGLTRGFDLYDNEFYLLDKAEDVQPRLRARLEDWPAFNGARDEPWFLFAHYCDPHEPYRSHADAAEGGFVVVELDGERLDRLPLADAPNVLRELELKEGEHRLRLTLEGGGEMLVKAVRVGRSGGNKLEHEFVEGGLLKRLVTAEVRFTVEKAGEHELRLWAKDVLDLEEIRARYVEEVEHVDRFVGDLLDVLRASGEYDDTLVVFVSDHGEALGERGAVGHVNYLHDPMIRVPLIVKPPANEAIASRLRARQGDPVSLIDIAPTILEICRVPAMDTQRGESLLRLERGRPFEHVAQTHKPEAPTDRVSLFDGTLRMVYVLDEDHHYLYDLSQDPGEQHDVFAERGQERPGWPARLETMAKQAAEITANGGRLASGQSDMLDALGYGGGDDGIAGEVGSSQEDGAERDGDEGGGSE